MELSSRLCSLSLCFTSQSFRFISVVEPTTPLFPSFCAVQHAISDLLVVVFSSYNGLGAGYDSLPPVTSSTDLHRLATLFQIAARAAFCIKYLMSHVTIVIAVSFAEFQACFCRRWATSSSNALVRIDAARRRWPPRRPAPGPGCQSGSTSRRLINIAPFG